MKIKVGAAADRLTHLFLPVAPGANWKMEEVKIKMLEYKAVEIVPEDFYAVINKEGKNYHFNIFHNAAAIKYQDKWGSKTMAEILMETSEAKYIGTIAYWLLSPEDRKDFKDENDFNEKLQPYYAQRSDLNSKVLKAMAIGFIKENKPDKEVAATAAGFPGASRRGNGAKAAKSNWFKRLFNIGTKPASNADKTV